MPRQHEPSYNQFMFVVVDVLLEARERPPDGAPVIVQVRDTSLQDAPARVLGEGRGVVRREGSLLARIEVPVDELGVLPTVWAHVDVDRNSRVSPGDFVTVQSFVVPMGAEAAIRVTVKQV